jgi:hypothetical protein
MGTVILDGKDISHLTTKIIVVSKVGEATRVRLDLVAVDIDSETGLEDESVITTEV